MASLLLLAAVFGFAFTVLYVVLSGDTQLLGVAMGGALCLLAAAASWPASSWSRRRPTSRSAQCCSTRRETEEVVEMIEAGGRGDLPPGAADRRRRRGRSRLWSPPRSTPLASLGPTLGPCTDALGAGGPVWSTTPGSRTRPTRSTIGRVLHRAARAWQTRNRSAPGCWWSAAGRSSCTCRRPARVGPRGDPRVLQDLPPRRLRDLAVSLSDLRADQSGQPAFTCPCHYSTFLPGEGGRLVFGPAGRALPQLPLMIDSDRNLRAAGPFPGDIGPSWWGVHREPA